MVSHAVFQSTHHLQCKLEISLSITIEEILCDVSKVLLVFSRFQVVELCLFVWGLERLRWHCVRIW